MQDSVRMKDVKGDQSDGRAAGIDNLLYSGGGPTLQHTHPYSTQAVARSHTAPLDSRPQLGGPRSHTPHAPLTPAPLWRAPKPPAAKPLTHLS
eukprot:scaffold18717_cov101-Isochrysis_galbana.AAC.2